jgi:hypothetical protein
METIAQWDSGTRAAVRHFDVPPGTELTEVGFSQEGASLKRVIFNPPIVVKPDEILQFNRETGEAKVIKRPIDTLG